jgi:hypothetical protein
MKLNLTKVSILWGLLNVQSGRCVIVRHHTPFMQYIYFIEFELIAPFQAHIKNFIHVISQKNIWIKFFIKTMDKWVEKKNC